MSAEIRILRLRWFNGVMGLIHLVQGVLMLALSTDFSLPVTAAFLEFDPAAGKEAGRDPDSLNITSFGLRPDPGLVGRMRDAGVDRVIFTLPSEERAAVTPLIDECAKLIS